MDAFVTAKISKAFQVRVGQYYLPLGYENYDLSPSTLETVDFSNICYRMVCTCIYPYFPYLSQLLPGSCRVEVPEDYRCRYLQLSDIGSDHGCLAFFGTGPVQLDTGRCHCYDLYQRVLCGSG